MPDKEDHPNEEFDRAFDALLDGNWDPMLSKYMGDLTTWIESDPRGNDEHDTLPDIGDVDANIRFVVAGWSSNDGRDCHTACFDLESALREWITPYGDMVAMSASQRDDLLERKAHLDRMVSELHAALDAELSKPVM